MALIETPGKEGAKEGIRTRVIGIIVIERCVKYESKESWLNDKARHLVEVSDRLFGYNESKEKWGWFLKVVRRVEPQMPPETRGIKFAKECLVKY